MENNKSIEIIDKDFRILLTIQMIADEFDTIRWSYLLNAKDTEPNLKGFELYTGQTEFKEGILYLLAKGKSQGFPIDRYPYVTSDDLFGAAPHIRKIKQQDADLINAIIRIFENYHRFEANINDVVVNNGSLSDLCLIGSAFFKNPMYIHDKMFTVIALPVFIEGMLEFERSEDGNTMHIPLALVNEFKFDEAYNETLKQRKASIWGMDQYPQNMRSLYVNLWDDNYYYGRLLINELQSSLKPGQFKLAEIFAEYVKMILRRDVFRPNKHYRDYEDTVRSIIRGEYTSQKDVNALLDILGWHEDDSYICLKIESQMKEILIKSDSALRSQLASSFPRSFDFFHEQRLCIIINCNITDTDGEAIKRTLASIVRDSYMYCGISYPIKGLRNIRTGFDQTDITLLYIEEKRSRWLMLFGECALEYMIRSTTEHMPAYNLVAPELLMIKRLDREKNTDYYNTLKIYLVNERSIPKTSDALIIHRTTLQYRLGKIEQITKLDLENEDVRLYLMMSYRILDYVASQHLMKA